MFPEITIEALREYSWIGYVILLLGMVFEGETVLMSVGAASFFGILSPVWVWISAALGTIFGDILWYFLGNKVGTKLMARYGKILFISEARIAALSRYLNSSQKKAGGLIMLAKYLYGFTHLTLVTIGASRLPFRIFITYTIPAALLWVSIFFAIGFVYADSIAAFQNSVPRVLGGFAMIVLVVTVISKFLGKYFEKKHLKI